MAIRTYSTPGEETGTGKLVGLRLTYAAYQIVLYALERVYERHYIGGANLVSSVVLGLVIDDLAGTVICPPHGGPRLRDFVVNVLHRLAKCIRNGAGDEQDRR